MSLIDPRGYVELNGRKVYIELLRSESPDVLAPFIGITEDQLRRWAQGEGLPLGLPWTFEGKPTEENNL